MVGLQVLVLAIGVRIPVPEHRFNYIIRQVFVSSLKFIEIDRKIKNRDYDLYFLFTLSCFLKL